MNVKQIRRQNMRALAQSIGGITPLSELLNKSQSQISHLIGVNPIKNIGDRIAAQTEAAFNKPIGWLDQQHYEIAEEQAIYELGQVNKALRFPLVPLLKWEQITSWLQERTNYALDEHTQLLPIPLILGDKAFALTVTGDSMEAPAGISFIEGATLIVDPSYTAKPGAYIICLQGQEQRAIFKQLIHDGNKRYLKPLNPRYPLLEADNSLKIIGVVRQMLLRCD